MTIPNGCPDCRGALTVTEAETTCTVHPGNHLRGQALEERRVATVIAACNGCEFIYELTAEEQMLFHTTAARS